MNKQIILQSMEEHQVVVENLKSLEYEIAVFAENVIAALKSGHKVLLMGNGGSAADSQHIAAEIVGRYKTERKGLPAIALTTDTSILTSVGNDYSFENIFARQVEALAAEGDVVIAISTSGNSKNIITALAKAKEAGCYTVGLLGKGGGKIKELVDLSLVVPSDNTPRIQECHILIGHMVCEMMDEAYK
jgi:D-sedoheptulose 7-phosphate isomerase